MQHQEIGKKTMEKTHLVKTRGVFVDDFSLGFKNPSKTRWFLEVSPWGLAHSWFLLEKHKAQTTPLKLILRSKIQSKRLAPLWIILLAEIRLNSCGLIDWFLCLGKILSSAAACCFFLKNLPKWLYLMGCNRHQPVIRPWKTSSKTAFESTQIFTTTQSMQQLMVQKSKTTTFCMKRTLNLSGMIYQLVQEFWNINSIISDVLFYSSGVYNMCLCCYVFVADINHHAAPYPRTLKPTQVTLENTTKLAPKGSKIAF